MKFFVNLDHTLVLTKDVTKTHPAPLIALVGKVKSAYEPKWPIRPELIPVSVALSN